MSNVVNLAEYREKMQTQEFVEGLTDLMCFLGGYENGEENIPDDEYEPLLISALNIMRFPQDLIEAFVEAHRQVEDDKKSL